MVTNGNDYVEGSTVTRFYGENDTRREHENEPLTKREYFAAMAMQGLLATGNYDHFNDVTDAVRYADALIKALNFIDTHEKESA